MYRYKEGDKVRLKTKTFYSQHQKGEVVIVIGSLSDGVNLYYSVAFNDTAEIDYVLEHNVSKICPMK